MADSIEGNPFRPDWESANKVHDWRNYASERLRAIWDTFTADQQLAIADCLQDMADREEWE